MPDSDPMPVFPDITPNRLVRSSFHAFEDSDIASEENLQQIMSLMYEHPERKYYLYLRKDLGGNSFVTAAEQLGFIQYVSQDFHYYPHPRYAHDFLQICPHEDSFEWEKETVATQPMYCRITLALTKKSERRFEHAQIAAAQKETSPLILRPTFFGVGIDLPKAWAWFRSLFRKLSNRERR